MRLDNNQKAFLALVRAGLWERDVRLSEFGKINLKRICLLAHEQSVIGLVAAGLEHVVDVRLNKEEVLSFVGETLQLEQKNISMNQFIEVIIEKMRRAGIYTLLLKGQGTAQCYERPLWRACGDIDFFLSDSNYNDAKLFFSRFASKVEEEKSGRKHCAVYLEPWLVELHGTLRGGVTRKIDQTLDCIKQKVIYEGKVRSWMNHTTQVFMLNEDEDVVFTFSHILQHFFQEGVGLRQVCDWCRLLWTYKDSFDINLLTTRLRRMGVMNEWKTFAALAVFFLGLPKESVPFFSEKKKWEKKAERIMSFIFKTGNFGKNRDYSYYDKHNKIINKGISFYRHTADSAYYFSIFPMDSIRVWLGMLLKGIKH